MVCGTKRLPVSRKNKSQHDMSFQMPVLACGNSFPSKWPNEAGHTYIHTHIHTYIHFHIYIYTLGQSSRRWMVSYWDRPVPKGAVDQKLPDKMDDERPYVLLLCIRAYHSLVRTLNGTHVDAMLPPDLHRDCAEVIAGTDDTTEFIRNSGLIRFDKQGIRSLKFIPVDVLINEWTHFKLDKYGKRESAKMTKREFYSILEVIFFNVFKTYPLLLSKLDMLSVLLTQVTGAVPLIVDEKDKESGSSSTFGVPKYNIRYDRYTFD
jgi:hypothetical protein